MRMMPSSIPTQSDLSRAGLPKAVRNLSPGANAYHAMKSALENTWAQTESITRNSQEDAHHIEKQRACSEMRTELASLLRISDISRTAQEYLVKNHRFPLPSVAQTGGMIAGVHKKIQRIFCAQKTNGFLGLEHTRRSTQSRFVLQTHQSID